LSNSGTITKKVGEVKAGETMQAFLVGLTFLVTLVLLSALGILLFPFILVGGLILGVVVGVTFFIFAIWFLGKVIIFVWEKFFKNKI
jgi:hypothetical protein